MKSSEFRRMILANGWRELRQSGSHIIYEKDGRRVVVPFHGSKEIKTGLVRKLIKEMNLEIGK